MDFDSTLELATTDNQPLTVRRLGRGDASALQCFNQELSFDSRRKFLPHAYDDDTVERALTRAERGDDYVLGLWNGDRLIGYFFLWYARERVPLLGVGILDEFQHRGLGRQLLSLLIDEAKATDRDGIELTTMQDNDNAYALYRRMGFEYLGDVDNRTGDGTIVVERAMFYRIKEGAAPMAKAHEPPV